MKQIRKISNIVAEELSASLEAKGLTLAEEAFEGKVSEIVNMISEAVKECDGTDKKDDGEAGILDEGVDVAEIYMATDDVTLGDVEIKAGEFVQIEEIDMDNEEISFIVYDEEGDVKIESAKASYSDVETFTDGAEIVDLDDEEPDDGTDDGTDESGFGKQRSAVLKKKGFSAKDIKLKAKLAAKKKDGQVNKFTIKNGKIVKKSADQLAYDKKKAKTFGKKMKRFAKKRAKAFKKNFKKFGAKEGFDITSGNMTFAVEEGDEIGYENGAISVARGGNTLISGLAVSEEFIDKCISEDVMVEGVNCDPNDPECKDKEKKDNEKTNEAALLTFESNKGFVMVKEGTEYPMGNRIRARAYLKSEGYDVTSEMLDNASDGKIVTL